MLSIIICAHNPDLFKLNLVLNSLFQQTEQERILEILVIDNCSSLPLQSNKDLVLNPKTRVILEEELGLSKARMRGVVESKGDLLLFLDDDTPIDTVYVYNGLKIGEEIGDLGCFGGSQIAKFEIDVPSYATPYVEMIGSRHIEQKRMSKEYTWYTTPGGAGMFIRKKIALHYQQIASKSQIRKNLGKRGNLQMCSEDVDMAYTSIDLGYNNGLFPDLKLFHYIPTKHLSRKYLLKRKFYNVYSNCLLEHVRFQKRPYLQSFNSFFMDFIKKIIGIKIFDASILLSERLAIRKAIQFIENN